MINVTCKKDLITLLLIVLVAMSGLMGIDIHLASVPYLLTALNAKPTQIKLIVSLYLLGFAIGLLIGGPLSDKYGRKPVVLSSLTFVCITSFLIVFTHTIYPFLLLRFFQGLGAGGSAGLGRSMAVDMFHKKSLETIRSYFSAIIGLSPLIAPLIGGYFQHYIGWQANFVFLGLLYLCLIITFSKYALETNQHIEPHLNLKNMYIKNNVTLLKHSKFVAATVLGGMGMSISIIYVTLSPFIFQIQYHLGPIVFGWLTMGVSLGIVISRLFNGYMIRKLGNEGVLLFGIYLVAIPGVITVSLYILNFLNISLVLIGILLTLSGQAFIRSNSMFVAMLPHHNKRGAAGSLFGSFQTCVAFICGLIISFFPGEGFLFLGVMYSLVGIISYLIYMGFIYVRENANVLSSH